ncbi:MAG TPA: amino acid ABC transporter permease [Solirubrobacterales bacterium]|nr:amino acid ABC transporter permease [Solirubrobacterales bacterium]
MTEAAAISPGDRPQGERRREREEAKRAKARRNALIAALSSVIVIGGLAALVLTSPGWPTVRETFFSWSEFKNAFPEVLDGFWLDIKVFMVVEAAVLVIALAIALIRVNRSPGLFPVRILATIWVDVFRGVPTVLLVYLVGFGIPALELEGLPTSPVVLGGIALTLSYSGYVSEVYRAGINSVHRGQTDAALSVGLTQTQTMRHVVLPQAIRRVAPPLLNDFVALQKDVALISIIGPQEAFRVAQIFQGENFNYTPIIAAAMLYLVITIPLARIVDRMGGAGGVR